MSDNHWESYYQSQQGRTPPPSQFAAFVAAEYAHGAQIFDIGCGNGRDTVFFAQYSPNVVGVDGSEAAIEVANAQAISCGSAARFVRSLIENPALADELLEHRHADTPAILYSRFFLHAITEAQQDAFFSMADRLCGQPNDMLALEFRTTRDRDLPKVTSAHYRRYVDPILITNAGIRAGFAVDYFIEGFGYAKYRSDDAYVARVIFKRS